MKRILFFSITLFILTGLALLTLSAMLQGSLPASPASSDRSHISGVSLASWQALQWSEPENGTDPSSGVLLANSLFTTLAAGLLLVLGVFPIFLIDRDKASSH